ncbi:hypothetical protein G6016_06880 [Dietzia aerolata]|uniref:Uncharacterized protein n=1 Tax=Dietzia aerolata TaxID=595984 RepID=A0ABV5JTK3_9ACTN|nr:hypothetical protein [Dietzia aerolata]MBB0968687.1 hypothetical protein [Dietzia aerolata]
MFTVSRKGDICLPVRVLTTKVPYKAGVYETESKTVTARHEAFSDKLASVVQAHGKTVSSVVVERGGEVPGVGVVIGCDFGYHIAIPYVSPPRRLPDELSSLLPAEISHYVNEEWSRSTLAVSPRASEGLRNLAELSYPAKKRMDLSCGICDASNRTTFVCRRCVKDVTEGLPVWDETSWQQTADWGLDALDEELEGLAQPPGKFSMKRVSPEEVRRAVVRMVALQGSAPWLERVAGKLGGVRTSRGMVSIAEDGHLCRSAFERTVDDFMHRNGIHHEVEPSYPFDSALNSNLKLKADWKLWDGTLVEAFGMMSSVEYLQRVQRKRELADRHSLKVLEIFPENAEMLPSIFAGWIRR